MKQGQFTPVSVTKGRSRTKAPKKTGSTPPGWPRNPRVETKQPEPERLKASDARRYRRLFEAAKDGILILDARTGMIDDVNPYLVDLLGYSRAELVERRLWQVGPFSDAAASQVAFETLQRLEYIRYDDLPLRAKNGRLLQVEYVSNVYTAGGKKVIQCNIRDVTERKHADLIQQEGEQRRVTCCKIAPTALPCWTRPEGWFGTAPRRPACWVILLNSGSGKMWSDWCTRRTGPDPGNPSGAGPGARHPSAGDLPRPQRKRRLDMVGSHRGQ